jgi:hypothetical protein
VTITAIGFGYTASDQTIAYTYVLLAERSETSPNEVCVATGGPLPSALSFYRQPEPVEKAG